MVLIPKSLRSCKLCVHGVELSKTIKCLYHDIEAERQNCCDNFDANKDAVNRVIQTYNEIIEAYMFLRKHNHTIPDETLDFMKMASIKALIYG